MECIACTACADACDEIMVKVNKPKKLISYNSISQKGVVFLKPRVLVYGLIILVSIIVLTTNVARRSPYYASLLRAKDIPYQILNDGKILNHLKIHILNQSKAPQEFEIMLPEDLKGKGITVTVPNQTILTEAGAESTVHFFVMFPREVLNQGALEVSFTINEKLTGIIEQKIVTLSGPI
jgi:polyferredoxin